MGFKSKAYIRKLKGFLETDDLINLTETQLEKLKKFVVDHPDPEVLGELLIEMGGKGPIKENIIETLNHTLKIVTDAGEKDVIHLNEIIHKTLTMFENENLTNDDRQQLNSLLNEFAQILREKSQNNDQIRLAIAGGAFFTVILIAGGFLWYKYKIDCLKIQLVTGGAPLLPYKVGI